MTHFSADLGVHRSNMFSLAKREPGSSLCNCFDAVVSGYRIYRLSQFFESDRYESQKPGRESVAVGGKLHV